MRELEMRPSPLPAAGFPTVSLDRTVGRTTRWAFYAWMFSLPSMLSMSPDCRTSLQGCSPCRDWWAWCCWWRLCWI